MDVVLLFPGQGSQKPGMGRDLAAAHPAAHAAFAAADAALGEPLSSLCFDGPADALTLTHNAQPALLAHGAAIWAVVREAIGPRVVAAAGHSLGEFTAYHAAGAMSLADAVRTVRRRGELMYATGLERPGTMAAILGDTDTSIDELCAQATASPEGGLVVPANYNSPGQIVISGEVAGVEKAMELCKAAGAKRAMRLTVSGAFHSPLMAPARDGLAHALAGVDFHAPRFPVVANVTAHMVRDADLAKRLLVEQLTAPVRWTEVMATLVSAHPSALFVEMGPGTVLCGLLKKLTPEAQSLACGTAADIDTLLSTLT